MRAQASDLLRTAHAAATMAAPRHTAISLLRAAGHPNIAAAAAMAREPDRVLNVIDRPHPRQHHETVNFGLDGHSGGRRR